MTKLRQILPILLTALVACGTPSNFSSPDGGTEKFGSTVIVASPPANVQFAQGTSSPTISQAQQANASNPNNLTITPQAPGAGAVTGPTGTPGNLIVTMNAPVSTGGTPYLELADQQSAHANWFFGPDPGNSGFAGIWNGNITPNSSNYLMAASATDIFIGPAGSAVLHLNSGGQSALSGGLDVVGVVGGLAGTNAFHWRSNSLNIAAGGTFTVASTVYNSPYITLTGSLAGNATVVLPTTVAACWWIDATAATLNAHTITLQANSVAWATTVGVTNIYNVCYGGAGKLYGIALTP